MLNNVLQTLSCLSHEVRVTLFSSVRSAGCQCRTRCSPAKTRRLPRYWAVSTGPTGGCLALRPPSWCVLLMVWSKTLMPATLVAVAHTDVPSWWSWSVCATSVGARQGQIYRGPRGQPFSLLSRDHDIINSLKCREFFSHTSLRKPLCSPTVHSYHLILWVGTLTLVKTYEKHQKKMSREKCAPLFQTHSCFWDCLILAPLVHLLLTLLTRKQLALMKNPLCYITEQIIFLTWYYAVIKKCFFNCSILLIQSRALQHMCRIIHTSFIHAILLRLWFILTSWNTKLCLVSHKIKRKK